MAQAWYYIQHGQRFGPVSAEEVKRLVRYGEIDETAQLSRDGSLMWTPITRMAKLVPLLSEGKAERAKRIAEDASRATEERERVQREADAARLAREQDARRKAEELADQLRQEAERLRNLHAPPFSLSAEPCTPSVARRCAWILLVIGCGLLVMAFKTKTSLDAEDKWSADHDWAVHNASNSLTRIATGDPFAYVKTEKTPKADRMPVYLYAGLGGVFVACSLVCFSLSALERTAHPTIRPESVSRVQAEAAETSLFACRVCRNGLVDASGKCTACGQQAAGLSAKGTTYLVLGLLSLLTIVMLLVAIFQ